MNLGEFIEKSGNTNQINRIPTKSRHSTLAKRYVNEVLDEHPEWFNIISALVSYPIQLWAIDTRNKLGINVTDIKVVLRYGESSYFGIKSERSLANQIKLTEQTNKIICFIGSSLNELCLLDEKCNVLQIVHSIKSLYISRYKFIDTYKAALIKFCEKYNDEFNTLYKEIETDYEELDDDCQFAFNNTELLLRLKKRIKYLATENVNVEETVRIIDECIKSLDTYIINPELLSDVLMLFSEGKSEEKMADALERSRTFVRERKTEGIRALSYLIWGYSVKNIIYNLK